MKTLLQKLLVVLSTYGILSAQTLSTSLSACYDFNGNALDMASALNGTVYTASLTAGHTNAPNSAYLFNGTSNSYIALPNDPLLKNTNAMSFVGWFKVNNFQLNDHIVFTKQTASSMFAAYSLITTGSGNTYYFRAYKENGSTSYFAQSTSTITLNTWYHVAVTIDNAAIKLYINGALQHSVAVTIPFAYDPTREVILGGTNESYNTPFNGAIDNLKFYRRILSAGEVSTLYTQDPSCLSFYVPEAGFITSASTVCVNKAIVLTDTSTRNPNQWFWKVPGAIGNNTLSANPTFTFNIPGVQTISLTSANSVGTSINVAVKTITVYPQPTVTATAPKINICNGESLILTAAGALTYTWSGAKTTATILVNPSLTTGYFVTGTNANGCTATASIVINVSDCVGLTEISDEQFYFYPNPAKDVLLCHLKTKASEVVSVYAATGELVRKFNTIMGINYISIADLSPGIYILVLDNTKEKKTFVKN